MDADRKLWRQFKQDGMWVLLVTKTEMKKD